MSCPSQQGAETVLLCDIQEDDQSGNDKWIFTGCRYTVGDLKRDCLQLGKRAMLTTVCAKTYYFVVAREGYMNLVRYAGYFMPATPLSFKILKYGYYVVVFCAQSQAKFLQQKWVVEATERKELSGAWSNRTFQESGKRYEIMAEKESELLWHRM